MPELLRICLIACPLVFLAGFVDSIAGGGGLISLPAYLLVGLPVHLASGTNKLVNCIGTAASALRYFKHGHVRLKQSLAASIPAVVGSMLGTRLAVYLDDDVLKLVLLCALPAAAVVLSLSGRGGKKRPRKSLSPRRELLLCCIIGFVIGCYDGIVGPGTGTFFLMAFSLVLGMGLLSAAGCSRVGNLASNLASAVVWLINGDVYFALVLPAAVCSILGNLLGSRFALRGGSRRVQVMIYVVLALLAIKLVYELFFQG